jgi:hypothetical protein
MKHLLWTAGVVLSLAAAAGTAHAQALPITGGLTSVRLVAAPVLFGAGLSVGTVGTAVVSPGSDGIPIAYFGVTGGSIDTASFAGRIEHDGSGLRLSSNSASVSLTDFVIDTTTLLLSGDVTIGSTVLSDVPLFNISLSGIAATPYSLALTAAAAGALSTVFGIPNLTGATTGLANTIPITTAIPEPATVASMLAGLALLGMTLGRRRGLVR